MKKLSMLIVSFIGISLILTTTSFALPVYITLEGSVDNYSDAAGLITEAGFHMGSIINFTVAIDFEREGAVSFNDGTEKEYVDPYGRSGFYVEYIGGNTLQQKDGGIFNAATDVSQYRYGSRGSASEPYTDWFEGFLSLGSADEHLSVQDIKPSPENWYAGNTFGFFSNTAYDSLGNASVIKGVLTIAGMSTQAPKPIPEPASIVLISIGFAGIAGFRKRKRTKTQNS